MITAARRLAIAAAATLTLGFAATPSSADDAPVNPDAGKALYAASFKNLKDGVSSMDQFKGRVVVMYFWATWCVPCRIETPNLVKLNEMYKGKGKDVTVIGLALDNGDKVRDFVKENAITYPVFYGGHDAVELGKTLGNAAGAIPFTVVIGKDGKLIQTFKGDIPNEQLEKIIDPLVG